MVKKTPGGELPGKRRGLGRAGFEPAEYDSASPELLKRAIIVAARTGGALRFGYTSDGGAYAIGIYGDGGPYTHYVSPAQELDIILAQIIELFESIEDDRATTQKTK